MKLKNIVCSLMVASIFCGAMFINLGFASTNPAPVLAILALTIYYIGRPLTIGKPLLLISGLVLLHGLVAISFGLTTTGLFLKTYAAAFFIYWGWSVAMKSVSDIEGLIRVYLVGSGVVASIGMIQGVGWVLGISVLYDYSWLPGWRLAPGGLLGMRLSSILYEPSQVAFTMGPAACLAVARLNGRCKHILGLASALQIILLFVLSSSSSAIAVLAIFVSLILAGGSIIILRMLALFSLPAIYLFGAGYFEDTFTKITGLSSSLFQVGIAENVNASTFTLYFHATTSLENFNRSGGFGGGIGSHEILTNFILAGNAFDHNVYNANSAGNLTFRLFSELGIFGLVIAGAFVFYTLRGIFLVKGNELLYHAAFAAGIFGFFIRNGTFAHYGIALYVIVFIQICTLHKSLRKPNQSPLSRPRTQTGDSLGERY